MGPELKEHQKIVTRNVLLYASISALILSGVTYWGMEIKGMIPMIFLLFSMCNLWVLYRFFIHENLIKVYFQGSVLIFIAVVLINAFSGGIDGVFNFFIPIIVLSGYSMKKKFGRFWLVVTTTTLSIFYFFDGPVIYQMNEVEDGVRPFFIFLSLIIGTIIMGGIYGEYFIKLILLGKLKSNQLNKKNEEIEMLLKEIHHRVKNNMQVISGLLSLQSSFIKDEKVKEYFKLSQDRIKTMAIVHEMLYEESDITSINLYEYIDRLINQLVLSMKGDNCNVRLNLNIFKVYLNIDTAITLGIIINEIVTNSLKHGIPGDSEGEISIVVEKLNPPYFVLHASDNGSGMKEDSLKSKNTFGINLINNLSNQLKGKISLDSGPNGTRYTLEFEEIVKKKIKV
ncbi:MAG: two-component sensor histidine kinase [Salibacteraceae bacterium]|jgi:two-component sensor histidine kinase